MPCIAGSKGKKLIRPHLIHVEFDERARFQIVERQCLTPFPQNGGRKGFAFNVNRVEIQVLLRVS
jgi:hypothetical protein